MQRILGGPLEGTSDVLLVMITRVAPWTLRLGSLP
jgi:hypothetical protein